MSSSACRSLDMNSINHSGNLPVGDCKPADLNGGNLSETPPAATCNSSNLKNVDQQPGSPPSNACNSSASLDDDTLLLLSNIFKEKCTLKCRIVTQSPNDNRDCSRGLNHIKSTQMPHDHFNDNQITTFCGFLDQNYVDFYRSFAWFDNIWYFWLPVLILVPANTATWIKVYRSSRGNLASKSALMLRRTRHVLILTSLISVCFIVFVTPITVLLLIEAGTDDIQYPLDNKKYWAVLQVIVECLYLCNPSFNFFLYILSGQRFRNSLKVAFCKTASRQVTPDIQFELQPKQITNIYYN